jgi:hypothetical protein
MVASQPQPRSKPGLVVFTFALVVLAIVGTLAFNYVHKRHAIGAIEAARGTVYFDDQPLHLALESRTFGQELKQFLWLRHPTMVSIYGKQVTDETLDRHVRALTSLEAISIFDVAVTDQAIARLSSLRSLKSITCSRDPRHKKIFEALVEPTRIEFTEVPLRDALLFLQDYHGIPLVADQAALAVAGLDDEMPITFETLLPTTLGKALDQMLAAHGLGWFVRDGAIVVTTHAKAQKSNRTADQLRRELPNLRDVHIDAH